ncbi:hypothetical protein, partial [Klebsiella variicola]|uniref:hypothetical protein n=1 Tax=Klebsiella variicola TaxID=244366 RepID=UPI001C482904
WDALRMNMMISYQELVRTFPNLTSVNENTSRLLSIQPMSAPWTQRTSQLCLTTEYLNLALTSCTSRS